MIWLTFLYWALGEVGCLDIGCCPDKYRGTIGWGGGITLAAIGQTLAGHMAWSTAALSSARLTPLTVKDRQSVSIFKQHFICYQQLFQFNCGILRHTV